MSEQPEQASDETTIPNGHLSLNGETSEPANQTGGRIRRLEELLAWDQLAAPDPAALGGFIRAIADIVRLKEATTATKESQDFPSWEAYRLLARRLVALERTPGYSEMAIFLFKEFGAEVGTVQAIEAVHEVERRLVRLLNKLPVDVRSLPLGEALTILRSAQTPAPPAQIEERDPKRRVAVTSPAISDESSVPQSLDSRAVGLGHEMLTQRKRINVTEIARRLGVSDRTKLYDLLGFRSLVQQDRESRKRDKRYWHDGTKDRKTRSIEAQSRDE